MLVKTFGAAMQGIDAIIITVEVAVERGYMYSIVGLPDTAVKESQERVRLALLNSGRELPRHHVVINLSPADVRKEGAAYDLPIAVAVMAGAEKIKAPELDKYMIMGELSLDGTLLPVKGVLPMAIMARAMKLRGMIVPSANATEAAVVNNLEV
ncbi:MAG: magnesium chelatase, partial [Muribaculaceae bacterium]|nr:magnesium chelatase [Muribaculaceae bacterium]